VYGDAMTRPPQIRPADPDLFQLGVTCWDDGDHTVIWQPITGRHVRLHHQTISMLRADPLSLRLGPVRARLDRFYLLRRSPRPDWPQLVPVRSRLLLTLVDEATLWLPVPGYRGAGGHGFRAFQLSSDAHRAWQAINDSRTVQQIADLSGVGLVTVQALLTTLASPELQALQLRDEPLQRRDLGLERLVDIPRPSNSRPEHLHGPAGETTLTWYHLHAITDGSTHFDDRETTIAHSLGLPHPALAGQRYGARLYDQLHATGVVPDDALVVEIGCGTGELAEAWLEQAGPHAHSRYLRVDLSPELLRTQATRVQSPAILGDGTALPLRDRSVDLIVNNEVIADMSSVPFDVEHPSERPLDQEILAIATKHGVELAPGRNWVNLGAWRFVAEIARVLKPGGSAWLSEFGVLDEVPQEAVQLDHPEVSIQFNHLAQVARGCGLRASIQPLAEALKIDLQAHQLARHSWLAVRSLARSRGVHLQARAWTPETLAPLLPTPVSGLHWVPFHDEGPGPLFSRFYALMLQQPADSAD
jgi:ubiquinone/menaquinone biosynthesis C-methylase UbiE